MADLPRSRAADCHPYFYFAGIDFLARFSLGFDKATSSDTGVYLRAAHLGMAFTLSTYAFINVLRRFISRTIHCDNGTNFIGASAELRRSMVDLSNSVQKTLLQSEIE